MKKNPKLLWIIGIPMVAAGIYLLVSIYTPSHYKRAHGTIVSQSTSTGYVRDVSFTTEDGKFYTGTDRSYTSDRQTGVPVTVAYDPADPQKTMRVVSDDGRTVVWGGVVALVGGGLTYLGLRKPHFHDENAPPQDQAGKRVMHTKKPKKK